MIVPDDSWHMRFPGLGQAPWTPQRPQFVPTGWAIDKWMLYTPVGVFIGPTVGATWAKYEAAAPSSTCTPYGGPK